MARSRKKYPYCKCENTCKWGKRNANRRVRHYKQEIPNGKWYKKIYNNWDICDYEATETWDEYVQFWTNPPWYQEPKEVNYYDYYRDYLRK